MSNLLVNIPYLEASDVMPNGNLQPSVTQGKPTILMIQGNFCHFCSDSKPAFQQLANTTPNITCVTIQTDGSPSETQASRIFPMNGVPCYYGFSASGKNLGMYTGGRDLASLKSYVATLQ